MDRDHGGIRRGAKRPAVIDLTAFGRQIKSQTLATRREEGTKPGRGGNPGGIRTLDLRLERATC